MKGKSTVTSVLICVGGCIVLVSGVLAQPAQTGGKGHSSTPSKSSSATKTTAHTGGNNGVPSHAHPQKAVATPSPKPVVRATTPVKGTDPLSQARPDSPPFADKSARPLDSPISAISDGGRMLLYLIPILGLIVGGVALARNLPQNGQTSLSFSSSRFKATAKGSAFGLLSRLQDSLKNPVRSQSIRSLKVIETLALGNTALHLVEARGRLLLIGAAPAGVTLLKEFQGASEADFASHFHALVEAAEVQDVALPNTEIVDELDEQLREVSSKLARRARRLRTVREVEADIE